MKCPRCKAEVYWKRGDVSNVILMFDPSLSDTFIIVKSIDHEIIEIKGGPTYTQHECKQIIDDDDMTDEDLRDEFWQHARIVANLYACPVCNVSAHTSCLDMRFTVKERTTEWPHKERFINYVDKGIIANARERKWL